MHLNKQKLEKEISTMVNSGINNMQILMNNPDELEKQNRLARSVKYWATQYSLIMHNTAVILYATKQYKLEKLPPATILRNIMQLGLLKSLKAFYLLTNKAFVYLDFDTPESAAHFQNSITLMDNCQISYVGYQSTPSEVWGSIEGLPLKYISESIHQKLEGMAIISQVLPTWLDFPDGSRIETSPVKICLQLINGMTIEKLPNYLYFDDTKTLLTITGKRKVCYNCEQNTHLSRDCTLVYCKNCKKMMQQVHACMETYADKVRLSPTSLKQVIEKMMADQFPKLPEQNSLENPMNRDDSSDQHSNDYKDIASIETIPYQIDNEKLAYNSTIHDMSASVDSFSENSSLISSEGEESRDKEKPQSSDTPPKNKKKRKRSRQRANSSGLDVLAAFRQDTDPSNPLSPRKKDNLKKDSGTVKKSSLKSIRDGTTDTKNQKTGNDDKTF